MDREEGTERTVLPLEFAQEIPILSEKKIAIKNSANETQKIYSYPRETTRWQCKLCTKITSGKPQMEMHLKKKHGDVVMPKSKLKSKPVVETHEVKAEQVKIIKEEPKVVEKPKELPKEEPQEKDIFDEITEMIFG